MIRQSNCPYRAERRTPLDLVDWIQKRYGQIDLDLAASDEYHLAERYFSKEISAFGDDWKCENGFFNPDFSLIRGYCLGAERNEERKHAKQIIGIVPTAITGNNYFTEIIDNIGQIVLLSPRVQYTPHPASWDAINGKKSSVNGPSMLLIWNPMLTGPKIIWERWK